MSILKTVLAYVKVFVNVFFIIILFQPIKVFVMQYKS